MHKSTKPDTLAYPLTPCRDRGVADGWWGRLRCPGLHLLWLVGALALSWPPSALAGRCQRCPGPHLLGRFGAICPGALAVFFPLLSPHPCGLAGWWRLPVVASLSTGWY